MAISEFLSLEPGLFLPPWQYKIGSPWSTKSAPFSINGKYFLSVRTGIRMHQVNHAWPIMHYNWTDCERPIGKNSESILELGTQAVPVPNHRNHSYDYDTQSLGSTKPITTGQSGKGQTVRHSPYLTTLSCHPGYYPVDSLGSRSYF